jgi:hypothetical protein
MLDAWACITHAQTGKLELFLILGLVLGMTTCTTPFLTNKIAKGKHSILFFPQSVKAGVH